MLHDPNETRLFPALPPEVMARLSELGGEETLAAGQPLFEEGDTSYDFFVVLAGQVRVTKQVGGEEILLTIHHPGGFTGEMSMLTGGPAIATGRSLGESRVLRVPGASFRQLIAECSPVAETILAAMAARNRDVDSQLLQQDKLLSLGKLAAGLAHELNNPAAAGRRAAGQLREVIARLEALNLRCDRPFSSGEQEALAALREEALTRHPSSPPLDPLAQSDLEEDLSSWLEGNGVAEPWRLAPTFAGAGWERDRLEAMAERFSAATLPRALDWLEGTLALAALVDQVEQSTARISDLVGEVKKYSFMDRAPQQEVDLREGLESTLKILAHKLRAGVTVSRDYDPDLPRVCAFGSELNQVWTNLIDNAIDAMKGHGHLGLRTRREGDEAVVEVSDDGPGIPAALQPRIFDAFFTTKGPGQGTGLGLDIVRRIVRNRHRGEIRVESRPGATRFQVRLPLNPPRPTAG